MAREKITGLASAVFGTENVVTNPAGLRLMGDFKIAERNDVSRTVINKKVVRRVFRDVGLDCNGQILVDTNKLAGLKGGDTITVATTLWGNVSFLLTQSALSFKDGADAVFDVQGTADEGATMDYTSTPVS